MRFSHKKDNAPCELTKNLRLTQIVFNNKTVFRILFMSIEGES